MHTVILYYKYTKIDKPWELMKIQRDVCGRLNLKGRVIIAEEGVNGTLEGKDKDIEKYCEELLLDKRFADISFKKSKGDGSSFPRLSVKVRSEIVTGNLGEVDINPNEVTGEYISAEKLHEWLEKGEEVYVVDMRTDYEFDVGHFENSVFPGMHLFKDLPRVIRKIENLKDKIVVTVCTGGVRCEKASGFLVANGFKKVYQLKDGIHTYMEKFPEGYFKGSLYVFDKRIVMGFNPKHEVVGKCTSCGRKSENYVNCSDSVCNRHFICCKSCLSKTTLCPMGCLDN